MSVPAGFVPPPYPYERLDALKRLADSLPGGVVDCSIGTPCDPVPAVAREAAANALARSNGYPPSAGTFELREAAARWLNRTFGLSVDATVIGACVGTKELVASLPHVLRLRDPRRDTVLYPAIAYPTYEMGATLAGMRAVPVPVGVGWHLDLDAIDPADAQRAVMLWLNEPGNPASQAADDAYFARAADWARAHGVVLASDECYVEFAPTRTTVLRQGLEGMLAVHSVSKRSNLAGARIGFYAGDPDLVSYLIETRKHAGLMPPTPMQAAAAAALDDDAHVDEQRTRYAERRALVHGALETRGFVHDGGDTLFYLWLRSADSADDGWELAALFAHEAGLLVAPGDLYGVSGADHVRLALVQPLDRLELALDRMIRTNA
jgi:succinyldiaminopimelate transaminase